jgi:hypothetical protein
MGWERQFALMLTFVGPNSSVRREIDGGSVRGWLTLVLIVSTLVAKLTCQLGCGLSARRACNAALAAALF